MARRPLTQPRPGMRPLRAARRRARIGAASAQHNGNGNGPSPALRARIGRPPGMPEVCRRYLARQAVGLLPTEATEIEEE